MTTTRESYRRATRWRAAALGAMLLAAVLAMGARCIERTLVFVDKDGYTHITGVMVNDTDIQGTHIMLQGTLFDDQGNVIAQKVQAPCPPDTQPHSEILFDIRFDNPNVPPYATYEVRPISGQAQAIPLADPNVVILKTEAFRFEGIPPIPGLGITDQDVLFAFGVRNRSGHPLQGVQGCAAVWDNHSRAIATNSGEIVERDATGIHPATLASSAPDTIFFVARGVPPGATQVQAWLWFGAKGADTSQFQFAETPLVTIQVRSLP